LQGGYDENWMCPELNPQKILSIGKLQNPKLVRNEKIIGIYKMGR
jgi:hypothetical protein